MGFLVEIDTNGTNPVMVKRLIEKELVDYIAMDIKAPLTGEYSKAIGVNAEKFLGKVKETVETLLRFGMDNEFRTTVVSTVHKKKEDIEEICRDIKGCKASCRSSTPVSERKL